MFTKKSSADVKKSTLKIQDFKKDSNSRLRHLKTILGKYNKKNNFPKNGWMNSLKNMTKHMYTYLLTNTILSQMT